MSTSNSADALMKLIWPVVALIEDKLKLLHVHELMTLDVS